MSTSTHPFQTEVKQLLDIVIHALYSDREIFVRELVSNASDALEKLRIEQLKNSDNQSNIFQPDQPLKISITTDEEARTITIADSGIGMTNDELVENLGTIAHSGTKKFLEAIKTSEGNTDLIGQFGVGFYSSFMVADKVEVFTHSWSPDGEGLKWESNGQDDYTISPAENVDRGTKIVIHLKEDSAEFSKEYRIRELLRRYSNFVPFPIEFKGERLNTVQAIWAKNKSEVKPEEYDEFFQFIAHTDEQPLAHMHFSADAPLALNALLFIPKENPESFGFGRIDPNVALYCHRVLIASKPEGLLPDWMRFLHGVVDSEDLPLNISREMLQDSSIIRKLNDIITKRFLRFLEDMAKNEPETYKTFYTKFSRFIKEGLLTTWQYKDSLGKLLRFESTFTEPGETTSFADYVTRMKEDQKDIYVLTGESRTLLEQSPYLETFKSNGLEVIFLTDSGDKFVIDALQKFDDKDIKPIDRADIDLPNSAKKPEGEALSDDKASTLSTWLSDQYKDKFSKISFGDRLVDGVAVALYGADDPGAEVRAYMKAMGQDVPESHPEIELNPRHALVKKLADLSQTDADLAKLVADQITNTALLRAGMLDNPADLADTSRALLERFLLDK
jgi:molecular chaperone HtpG